MDTSGTNPTVTVPVAAVNLINRAIDLFGDALLVTVWDQEVDGLGMVKNAWVAVEWAAPTS